MINENSSSSSTNNNDNVKVFIRVRPANPNELNNHSGTCVVVPKDINQESNSLILDSKPEPKVFTFDYVADENVTQEEMFMVAGKPITEMSLSG